MHTKQWRHIVLDAANKCDLESLVLDNGNISEDDIAGDLNFLEVQF
jgi:hypothetical protein